MKDICCRCGEEKEMVESNISFGWNNKVICKECLKYMRRYCPSW